VSERYYVVRTTSGRDIITGCPARDEVRSAGPFTPEQVVAALTAYDAAGKEGE
jgi:hypothetical protein